MKQLSLLLTGYLALAGIAQGATLYLGGYPSSLLVFDEGKGAIVDRIPLTTGLPTSIRLSNDKKTIYVVTNDHTGIEVVDVATHKVTNHFVLNTPTKRYRLNNGVTDPSGKLFYTVTTEIDKLVDHFDIGKPKYTIIDLAQQKIVKTFDIAKEDEAANMGGYGRSAFEISTDGKYLYQFRDKVMIFDAADFKLVDSIELSKPDLPGMEDIGFGGQLDSIGIPGQHVSLFNSSDPYVHNRVFGIAHFDLQTRHVDYTEIGPSPSGMAGLQVSPDKKDAYTVVTTGGNQGNKRCEFWHFDLATNRVAGRNEFSCRTRFSFGISGDGKKLYIYGAGFEIEVYDAATMKYEKTWDLNNDVTMGGLIAID
jgi:DNA-binding beta-propeller fold protein YncE